MTDHRSPTLLLAEKLIECPSITPLDANCQVIIASHLEKMGFNPQSLAFGNVQNLWARRGQHNPIFVFAGHTDVVPPGNLNNWGSPPFKPTIKDGYLYGRGAADMKGSLAAMLTATERFLNNHPNHLGSIAFLITSDEEGPAQDGTVKVIEYLQQNNIKLDYCLVGEPSSKEIVGDTIKNGRRGSLNCYLKIKGKQGHIAYPQKAINPIHHALLPLSTLISTKWDNGNDFFPPTSLQIANINAGTGTSNVIPETLECHFNFRFSNESTPQSLINQIKEIFSHYPLQYELNYQLSGMPFLTSSGKLVSSSTRAVQEIANITPTLSTNGGTSDGRFIAATGTETIELGPCNATIHCINECVKIADLETLSHIYERILELMLLPNEKP